MAIPSKAVGYGNNSTATNVFRASPSTALSSAPNFKAWDNSGTYPAVAASVSGTVLNTVLAGTAGNSSKSMVCLYSTSALAQGAATSNWKPASATGGAANPNRLKGSTSYVTDANGATTAGGFIKWNMVLEIPSDVVPGTSTMGFDLAIEYTYTGAAPTWTWTYNDAGSEGTPSWTPLTPNTNGVKHCRLNSSSPSNLKANVPASGTEDTAEGWVTT